MSLKRNIPLIYATDSLMWARFFIPVLALFYIASQVPIAEFSIIMSVFALTILVLEIPSGVVADMIGRKRTLLLSRAMYIMEIFILAFFNGFWPFLMAKVLSGIGVSLFSGTRSALLYETLKKLGREREHKRVSGNINIVTSISMAFVLIIGAFLFSLDPKLPALASLPFVLFGFVLTFFLEEPYKPKGASFRNAFRHLSEGLGHFRRNRALKAIAIYSVPPAVAIHIAMSMSSFYLEAVLIPVSLIGVVAFVGSFFKVFGSRRADTLEDRIGEGGALYLMQALVIAGTFLMALMVPYVGALVYLLIPLAAGFMEVLVNHYMNCHVVPTHRATMLSIRNMLDNLGIFILFPVVGYVTQSGTITQSYSIVLFVMIAGLAAFQLYRSRNSIRVSTDTADAGRSKTKKKRSLSV